VVGLPGGGQGTLAALGATPPVLEALAELFAAHTGGLAAPGPAGEDRKLPGGAEPDPGTPSRWALGRVVRAERGAATVATQWGEERSLRTSGAGTLAVGDWVLALEHAGADLALVASLPRTSALVRKVSDARSDAQVLAANVDDVLVVLGTDQPQRPARVERLLALAWASGARPILALAKAELLDEGALLDSLGALRAVAPGVAVLPVSAHAGVGLEALRSALTPGGTAVLVGGSGAGKSTLLNALPGGDVVRVGEVRAGDRRGRHTTAWRELRPLPSGGAVIDTPGLRQLGLSANEGLAEAFSDVAALSAVCRFSGCRHGSEPGCAVREAIAAGLLDPLRVERHEKLEREAAFVARKADQRARREEQLVWKRRSREARARRPRR
jgi:ribosome biogenesis GTPase